MKNIKLLILFVFCSFIPSCVVKAADCDSNDIARLKVLANNVDISYEYNYDIKDSDGFIIYDTYKVIIGNMTDELYIVESKTNIDFRDYSINNGEIVIDRIYSGSKAFNVYSKTCNKKLKTFYVKLPNFNYYSTEHICDGLNDILNICDEFYDSSNLNYEKLYNIVDDYKNGISDDKNKKDNDENSIINFIKNNYLHILIGGGILVILIIILLILRHKKRGALE